MQSILLSIVFSSVGFLVPSAHAYLPNAKMPVCLDGPNEMRIDNARVLKFKATTKNQYLDRGFVEGRVLETPDVQNDHDHFVISIGPGKRDTLEIVYNTEFGAMPPMKIGDPIVVCGDYITSIAKAGGYDASSEGAIMHWIHFNPGTRSSSSRHEHGFVMLGSNLVGFDEAPLGDWDGRIIPAPQPGKGPKKPNPTEPEVKDGDAKKPTRRNADPTPRRRTDDRDQGSRRPNSGRWKPCRSLEECRARNGE